MSASVGLCLTATLWQRFDHLHPSGGPSLFFNLPSVLFLQNIPVSYLNPGGIDFTAGFVVHPDGYSAEIVVPGNGAWSSP
jgi:hypothetical protein